VAANMLTYKFKIKSGQRHLRVAARKVNFIWNYCNQTSLVALKRDGRFLRPFDLNNLVAGTSKIIKLHSQTVQAVAEEFATKRLAAKKAKLRWRVSSGRKKSLGWVPFKSSAVKIEDGRVIFSGLMFGFFAHRPIEGKIKTGCFVEDSCGEWYLCVTCEVQALPRAPRGAVGIDLGLKELAATSDGDIFENPKTFTLHQVKLAAAQRSKNKKRTTRIHRKIARVRKDNLHKISAGLTNNYAKIIIGNLKLKSSKSVNDASFRGLITLLEYKASRRQGEVVMVHEAYTTMTCSNELCLAETGPTGIEGLAVREWTCAACGQMHHRDINSAKNILRLGIETPKTSNKPQAS
jgi:putative transposase